MEAHGTHGTGTTAYTEDQYLRVVAYLLNNARHVPVTVAQVAHEYGLSGNAVRAIVRWADGREFVLAPTHRGYKLAANQQEAARGNNILRQQINTMSERVDRRMAWVLEHLL